METIALLLCDYYKLVHNKLYDPRIVKLVSYYTPRSSRLPMGDNQTVIMFGLQGFIKEYLIDNFNKNFFDIPIMNLIDEMKEFMDETFYPDEEFLSKIKELHYLGYLPLEIRSIPEGTKAKIGCPMIELSTTHESFPWIGEFIESMISSYIWKPMIDANVAHWYRNIVDKYYDDTVEDSIPRNTAMSEFGFRGADSPESGIHSGAAWLTSFKSTATCGAIKFIERYYNGSLKGRNIGGGLRSTEHSIMCSSAALDGDEETFIKNLLTKLAPSGGISMVSDSYDYWNVVTNILPKLKKEILSRNGTLFVRGDSGDPIRIVSGYSIVGVHGTLESLISIDNNVVFKDGDTYTLYTDGVINKEITEYEAKGTVEVLYDIFGGYTNPKGYKVLDNHIRAIYGDSITQNRAEMIYKILKLKGFASNNVALGAGSFSFHCYENGNGKLYPYTRDTYGCAIKATYCEWKDENGVIHELGFCKDPKTNDNTDVIKKSMKGCCAVYKNSESIHYLDHDGMTFSDSKLDNNNCLDVVFLNGKLIKETSLESIRKNLYGNKF
jgi:nicotinamide phosphoribosyltransferase